LNITLLTLQLLLQKPVIRKEYCESQLNELCELSSLNVDISLLRELSELDDELDDEELELLFELEEELDEELDEDDDDDEGLEELLLELNELELEDSSDGKTSSSAIMRSSKNSPPHSSQQFKESKIEISSGIFVRFPTFSRIPLKTQHLPVASRITSAFMLDGNNISVLIKSRTTETP